MSDQPKPTGYRHTTHFEQQYTQPKPTGEPDFVDCSESAKFVVKEMFEYGWLNAVSRDQATEWLRDWLSHAKHPTKPTGEWTAAYVAGLAMKLGNAPQHVADAHNAALAAEREISKEWFDKWGDEKAINAALDADIEEAVKQHDELLGNNQQSLVDALIKIANDPHCDRCQIAVNALAKIEKK